MSLNVAVYLDGNWIVCADSRVSHNASDGKKHFVTDDFKKIRQYGNKIVFASGGVDTVYRVFTNLKPNISINQIRDVIKNHYKHGDEAVFVVYTFEDKQAVVYELSSIDNFKIKREVKANKDLVTAGAKSPEASAYIINYAEKETDLQKIIIDTYNHYESEIIGGTLYWFVMSPDNGVKIGTTQIKNKKQYPTWQGEPFPYHCDANGNLVASSAQISGNISSSTYIGGTITGSSIYGTNIIGGTVTGATVQTASTTNKIIMDSAGLRSHDLNGVKRISIDSDGNYGYQELRFYGQNAAQVGTISGTNGQLNVAAASSNALVLGGNKVVM